MFPTDDLSILKTDQVMTDFLFFSSNIGSYIYRLHPYPAPTPKTQTPSSKNTNKHKYTETWGNSPLCFPMNIFLTCLFLSLFLL